MLSRLFATLSFLLAAVPATAEDLTALARLTGQGARIAAQGDGLRLVLPITQAVPYRVFTLDAPPRVVLDFSELDWSGLNPPALEAPSAIRTVRAGLFRPGWTRMVLELSGPMAVDAAGMQVAADGSAVMALSLVPTTPAHFTASAGAPEAALFAAAPAPGDLPAPRPRQDGSRPLVVVLDPGHGGIDPGAEREGVVEAALMLTFARELKEVLLRTGRFEVVLTREDDRFVPLETRVSIAREAQADVFISLHADALAKGRANGATIYTLSEDASDIASQKLAERHDRADLLAGVDLSRQGDEVALVLMELARAETAPRSERLADALVEGIYSATGLTYKTPRLSAGFSVLKAPDIPSVLVELGFLSSKRDRERLISQTWRTSVAEGIRDALLYWAIEDAAEAERLRK